MSSEEKVRVTVEACGEVRAFECRGAALSTVDGDGSGDSCFVGPTDLSDLFALACEFADTLYEAFRQAGAPGGCAGRGRSQAHAHRRARRRPRGHVDGVQTLDLDARREIRDMAAELGFDADF